MSLAGMNAIALGQPGGVFSGLTSGLASLLDAYERRQDNQLGRAAQARDREADFRDSALLKMLTAPVSESRLQPTTTWNEETGERSTTNTIVPFERQQTAEEMRASAERLGLLDRLGLGGPSPAPGGPVADPAGLAALPPVPSAQPAPRTTPQATPPIADAVVGSAAQARAVAQPPAVPPNIERMLAGLDQSDQAKFLELASRARSGRPADVMKYQEAIRRLGNANEPIRGAAGPTVGRTQQQVLDEWMQVLSAP